MNRSAKKKRPPKKPKSSTRFRKVNLSPAPVTPDPPELHDENTTVYNFEIIAELKKINERVDDALLQLDSNSDSMVYLPEDVDYQQNEVRRRLSDIDHIYQNKDDVLSELIESFAEQLRLLYQDETDLEYLSMDSLSDVAEHEHFSHFMLSSGAVSSATDRFRNVVHSLVSRLSDKMNEKSDTTSRYPRISVVNKIPHSQYLKPRTATSYPVAPKQQTEQRQQEGRDQQQQYFGQANKLPTKEDIHVQQYTTGDSAMNNQSTNEGALELERPDQQQQQHTDNTTLDSISEHEEEEPVNNSILTQKKQQRHKVSLAPIMESEPAKGTQRKPSKVLQKKLSTNKKLFMKKSSGSGTNLAQSFANVVESSNWSSLETELSNLKEHSQNGQFDKLKDSLITEDSMLEEVITEQVERAIKAMILYLAFLRTAEAVKEIARSSLQTSSAELTEHGQTMMQKGAKEIEKVTTELVDFADHEQEGGDLREALGDFLQKTEVKRSEKLYKVVHAVDELHDKYIGFLKMLGMKIPPASVCKDLMNLGGDKWWMKKEGTDTTNKVGTHFSKSHHRESSAADSKGGRVLRLSQWQMEGTHSYKYSNCATTLSATEKIARRASAKMSVVQVDTDTFAFASPRVATENTLPFITEFKDTSITLPPPPPSQSKPHTVRNYSSMMEEPGMIPPIQTNTLLSHHIKKGLHRKSHMGMPVGLPKWGGLSNNSGARKISFQLPAITEKKMAPTTLARHPKPSHHKVSSVNLEFKLPTLS